MSVFAPPGTDGSVVTYKSRYENWIGGTWVPPVKGQYFENPSPVNGKTFCEVARSTAEDIELALDAAHAAAPDWGRTSVAERAVPFVLSRPLRPAYAARAAAGRLESRQIFDFALNGVE